MKIKSQRLPSFRKLTRFVSSSVLIIFFVLLPAHLFAEKIVFSADSMSGTAGDKSDTTSLSGNAFVKTETMEITADSIEMKGDNFRYIYATGKITGKNTESNMSFTCDRMKYDRETKIAELENTVHLIDEKNNVTADAQIIDYNQNTEIALMQINVTLKQKDNVCTAAYAVYRKNAQMLEMSGNPKIVQGQDTFRAQEITLNLDTQEITLDGRVSGSVTDNGNNDEENKKPADAPDGQGSDKASPAPDAGATPPDENQPPADNTDNSDTEQSTADASSSDTGTASDESSSNTAPSD